MYQKFFQGVMKKFGISSPDELDDDKKKEIFNYVDKNYQNEKRNRLGGYVIYVKVYNNNIEKVVK